MCCDSMGVHSTNC